MTPADPDPRTAAIDERLRRAFREACITHDISGEVGGAVGQIEFSFAGQENADAALMLQAFAEELEQTGAAREIVLPSATMTDADVERVEAALRHAVARLRTLLIEHNSYLSGGLTYAFPGPPELRDRGLAIYRFPARADVEVAARGDGIRIAVGAGDLGEVTSSGFYVPTRIRGDFSVTIDYRLEHWQPGPASVCLALFAQDEPSVLRYYAQRRTAGGAGHEVLGNFNNDTLTPTQLVEEATGSFRIERTGQTVTTSHARHGEWAVLGSHAGDPPHDVIVGAKIWSSGEVGGFVADLSGLVIAGEIPADQIPPVPVREDPRISG